VLCSEEAKMSLEAWGAVAEIFGAVAVIFSIGYLALQVRENSKIALAVSERELTESWIKVVSVVAQDEFKAATFIKGAKDYESLEEVESVIFDNAMQQLIANHLIFFQMYEKGFASEAQLESVERHLVGILRSPGGATHWSKFGSLWLNYERVHKVLGEKQYDSEYAERFEQAT
jgi:hypothetical protein